MSSAGSLREGRDLQLKMCSAGDMPPPRGTAILVDVNQLVESGALCAVRTKSKSSGGGRRRISAQLGRWGGESEEQERGPLGENRVGGVQGRGDSVLRHVAVTI